MKKKEQPINIVIILSSILCSVLILTSCKGNIQDNTTIPTYWRENPSGNIDTNDMEKLQDVVPFEIILPDYLPEELAEYPPDIRYSRDESVPGEITLSVLFQTTQSPNRLLIEVFILPGLENFLTMNDNFQYNVLMFKGIQVLERTVNKTIQEQQIVYIYRWIMNDINFQMYVEGYSEDEARKVVESMMR